MNRAERRAQEKKVGKLPPLIMPKPEPVSMNPKIFRHGTKLSQPYIIHYVFTDGGLGDYINWCAAIVYIARECPHIHGFLHAPTFALPLLRMFMDQYQLKHWQLFDRDQFQVTIERTKTGGGYVLAPNMHPQLINATGAHLLDLGFMYFAGIDKAPDPQYDSYPQLKFETEPAERLLRDHVSDRGYAVMAAGSTTNTRALTSSAMNILIDAVCEVGLTPVFLGKSEVQGDHKTHYQDGVNWDLGIDLRDRTNLLEAGSVMQGAQVVLGLDNGLLHLACTTDVPVIFGYNITSVEHRKPRRRAGTLIDVYVPESDLSCIGCQSRMRGIPGIDFKHCFYRDLKCIDLLFADNGVKWRTALSNIMREYRT